VNTWRSFVECSEWVKNRRRRRGDANSNGSSCRAPSARLESSRATAAAAAGERILLTGIAHCACTCLASRASQFRAAAKPPARFEPYARTAQSRRPMSLDRCRLARDGAGAFSIVRLLIGDHPSAPLGCLAQVQRLDFTRNSLLRHSEPITWAAAVLRRGIPQATADLLGISR
jgi:hypothetical protein